MKPDADQICCLYQMWKDAVDQIADVEGLYPTFVLNLMPKSANTIAKMNGVGNAWGLDDNQSWICKSISDAAVIPSPRQLLIACLHCPHHNERMGTISLTTLAVYQTSTAWARAEDDLRMTAWSRSLIEAMHSSNQALQLASNFLYMGDAGEFQDPFAGFPAENVQRLKEIRAAYDPDRVFQRLNWGGFKLPY